jgi:hypothetical protein
MPTYSVMTTCVLLSGVLLFCMLQAATVFRAA